LEYATGDTLGLGTPIIPEKCKKMLDLYCYLALALAVDGELKKKNLKNI
tara:strand:+ start:394 stop:540 length:147 start_codon:yes stop_codon:yes gene_type:complete